MQAPTWFSKQNYSPTYVNRSVLLTSNLRPHIINKQKNTLLSASSFLNNQTTEHERKQNLYILFQSSGQCEGWHHVFAFVRVFSTMY